MSDQMAGFNARVKRIKDPRNTYYIDPETGTFVPKRVTRTQVKQAVEKQKARVTSPSFFGFFGALFLGAVALMGAVYLRWNVLGMTDGATEANLLIVDFGLAAVAMFVLGSMLNQKSLLHMLAHSMGIGAMLVTMHNLVWMFPAEFGQVYSDAYVQQVQSTTAPQSIYLGTQSIAIPTITL